MHYLKGQREFNEKQYGTFCQRDLFLPGAYSVGQMQSRSKDPVSFERPKAQGVNLLLAGHYKKERMQWSERQPAWATGSTHYKKPVREAEKQIPKREEDMVMRYVGPGIYEREPLVKPEIEGIAEQQPYSRSAVEEKIEAIVKNEVSKEKD